MSERIKELQTVEQNLQAYGVQKHAAQQQQLETESALRELEKSPEAFRIVGNLMVKAEKPALEKELRERRETLRARVETIERQEARLRTDAERLQEAVLSEMRES